MAKDDETDVARALEAMAAALETQAAVMEVFAQGVDALAVQLSHVRAAVRDQADNSKALIRTSFERAAERSKAARAAAEEIRGGRQTERT